MELVHKKPDNKKKVLCILCVSSLTQFRVKHLEFVKGINKLCLVI